MIEEEREPRGAEEAGEGEAAPKKGRGWLKIVAIGIALILAGVGVWYFVFSNSPPQAAFTHSSIDLQLTVDATPSLDPDGSIATYTWSWGDGSTGTGEITSHTYATTRDYDVTLTVRDIRGASGAQIQTVSIRFAPTANFIARASQMTLSFDASRSTPSAGSNSPIATYAWAFGDGATGTGVTTSHTYTQAKRYQVDLTVTDQAGGSTTATRFVSPADTTVDILLDQFFTAGCPFNNYWELRYTTYGDSILSNSVPCTDYYPWVLFTTDRANNPSYVYTLYRWDARVRNFPGYDLNEPVMLPVLAPSVAPGANSYIQFNLTMEYLNNSLFAYYANTPYPMNEGAFSDGFGYLVRGNITMDLTMSKRVFGVVANTTQEARDWWSSNTTPGGINSGVETRFARWLEDNGNGKYDIWNGFEWYYQTDITDLNATVDEDGTTHVSVFWDGFGYDVLMARWFYWGRSSYRDAVCVDNPTNPADPCPATRNYGDIQPEGWMPMESCWCEHANINGTITSRLDLDFNAIQAYSFKAWGNAGNDGVVGTQDDKPAWVLDAVLMDYVPRMGDASGGFPNSELRWYEGLTATHGAPGSFAYGDQYEYLVSPTRWPLNTGSTLTLVLPQFDIPWYDPVQSAWNPTTGIGDYVTFDAPLTLREVKPFGNYFLWDPRAKVISIAGPYDWGQTGLPTTASPWIEFGPVT